ncbi:MAG: hypothetical protein R3F59_05150 [Myxococcota bacterium]
MWAGVTFETRPTADAAAPERADGVAFVGFVALRLDAAGLAPEPVRAVWRRLGWVEAATDLPVLVTAPGDLDAWLDGWVTSSVGLRWEGYLLGAVRDFFRQGGRRCWVVPAGPPVEPPSGVVAVTAALDARGPGGFGGAEATPADRATWRGLARLLDLPEVALVALPDLPATVGAQPSSAPVVPAEPVPVQQFVECATPPPAPPDATVHRIGPPRLAGAQWDQWRDAVAAAVRWLVAHRPDVQLVAALPLGEVGSREEGDPLPALLDGGQLAPLADGGVATAWLQLAWPWARVDTSGDRLGGLAPPDGLVAGLLARNALLRGTFRSAGGLAPEGVQGLEPTASRRALWQPQPVAGGAGEAALLERLTVLGRAPQGLRLLSDCTTATDPAWRQGGVARLVGVVRREAQRAGEGTVFAANGANTWRAVRRSLAGALTALQRAGGLHPVDGFEVRCGPDTMTQQDLDAGRLVATVLFRPVQAIEHIAVVLSLLDGGADVTVRGAA